MLLLVVFGIKAALFPLFFWLPDSYPTAPVADHRRVRRPAHQGRRLRHHPHPDAAASRATPGRPRCCSSLAAATMVVGVLGAIAQDDVRRILSFNIVSQIGYMVMGLGFFTVAGLAAVVFSIDPPHRREDVAVPRSAASSSTPAARAGSADIGGMVRTAPFLAVLFLRLGAQPRRHPAAVRLRLEVRAHRRRLRRRASTRSSPSACSSAC